MSILLEGSNFVGKTTFGMQFAAVNGWEYKNIEARTRQELFETGLKQATDSRVVYDRWWPTDWVYSAATPGREPALTAQDLWILSLNALRHGSPLVIMRTKLKTLLERRAVTLRQASVGTNLQGTISKDTLRLVNQIYNLGSWLRYRPDTVFMASKYYDIWCERLLTRWEGLQTHVKNVPGHGIGAVHGCRLLVVGEQVNPETTMDERPFIGTESLGTCGIFYRLLEATNLRPADIHVINAFTRLGVPAPLREINRYLRPLRIITFGRRAERETKNQGLTVTYFEHPSWIRRFHYLEIPDYVEKFKDLIKTLRI